ncbi:MAG: NUDIX domain-containing protein [Nanoarchaeota archaeon]
MNRTRVRAIIVENNSLVLIHRKKTDRDYFVFPGGGVESEEGLEGALARECLEELGVNVDVKNLQYKFVEKSGATQFFYRCSINGGVFGSGKGREFSSENSLNQYALERVDINRLRDMPIFPDEIKQRFCLDVEDYRRDVAPPYKEINEL